MAGVPAPQGIVRVRLTWNRGGKQGAQNVFHVDFGNEQVSETTLGAFITKMEHYLVNSTADNTFLGSVTGQWAIVDITAEDAGDLNGAQVSRTVNHPGTASGNALPPNVAAVTTWTTTSRGRSFRGRTFLPGINEAEVDENGLLGSTRKTVLQSGMDTMITKMVAEDVGTFPTTPMVVVSYISNGAPRPVGVATVIQGAIVRAHMHTQRRRQTAS